MSIDLGYLILIPRRLVAGLIRLYQKTLSLDHGPLAKYMSGPTCKYHPTCSQYGYEAMMKYGVSRGLPKTLWRILRCNPWSKGGIDRP